MWGLDYGNSRFERPMARLLPAAAVVRRSRVSPACTLLRRNTNGLYGSDLRSPPRVPVFLTFCGRRSVGLGSPWDSCSGCNAACPGARKASSCYGEGETVIADFTVEAEDALTEALGADGG